MDIENYFHKTYKKAYEKVRHLSDRILITDTQQLPPKEYMKDLKKSEYFEYSKSKGYIPILFCSSSMKMTFFCPSIIRAYKKEMGVLFRLFFRAVMFHELYHQVFPEKEEEEIWEYMKENNRVLYFFKTRAFPKDYAFLNKFWSNDI